MSFLNPYAFLLLFFMLFLYKRTQKTTLLFISIIFMILSFSRPVLTKTQSNQLIDAKEFILALDLSYSMNADDLTPSRLEVAKEMIKKMIYKNPKDNFCIFAFTSNALILSPFTTDSKLLLSALKSIKMENILTHATDISALLKKVSKLKISEKNLIIFSDGGDELDISKVLENAKLNHITIYGVGVATKKGTTIKDSYNKLIRDDDNHLVITRLNPLLKELSINSGGKYFDYDSFDTSLSFVKNKNLFKKSNTSYIELFSIPLFISLVLFLLHFVQIPKKVFLIFPFLSSLLNGSMIDWYYISKAKESYESKNYKLASMLYEKIDHKTMQSQLNLANSYYQSGSFKKANHIYKNLKSKDNNLKKKILFKLANTEVMLKKYDEAKIHYQQALSFGYDKDILHNLNLIIKKHTKRRDYPAAKTKKEDAKSLPQGKNNTKNLKSKSKGKNQAGISKSSAKKSKNLKSKDKSSSSNILSHPLGYKAYDTINKGYINEKKPW